MGHKLLAEIYEKEGKISNAISEYLSTIEIRPQNFEMNCKIATLLHVEGKDNEAINLLQDLLKRDRRIAKQQNCSEIY